MNDDANKSGDGGEAMIMEAPIYLQYQGTAGRAASSFLKAVREGRLLGQRVADQEDVYAPSRGSCPRLGLPTSVDVPMTGIGTVESFTVVHIPIPGNPIKPPFVVANILLDGACVSFIHLLGEVANEDVRIGMKVEPVWRPKEEWGYTFENVEYFKPAGGEDVDVDRLRKNHGA